MAETVRISRDDGKGQSLCREHAAAGIEAGKCSKAIKMGFDSPQISRNLLYHIKTAFLLTRSDFKTVIVPQSLFAFALAWNITRGDNFVALVSRLPHVVGWIWVHLAVEDLANQRLPAAIVEDHVNKPWRPLPSGRITQEEARVWLLAGICTALGLSAMMGALLPSLSLMTSIWMYNDLDGSSSGPFLRNALNAAGLMCFSFGGLLVLVQTDLTTMSYAWILFTGLVICTTVHAQDLPDKEGDKARNRQSAYIMFDFVYGRNLGPLVARVLRNSLNTAQEHFDVLDGNAYPACAMDVPTRCGRQVLRNDGGEDGNFCFNVIENLTVR
nr:hypothetical protein [Stachybotrys sp.]